MLEGLYFPGPLQNSETLANLLYSSFLKVLQEVKQVRLLHQIHQVIVLIAHSALYL